MIADAHVSEPAALRKEGQMAISKSPEWEPPASRLGTRSSAASKPCRRLYRAPQLPVVVGAAPAGGVVSLQKHKEDTRDWRRLRPEDVAKVFRELDAAAEVPINRVYPLNFRRSPEACRHLEGMMVAVAVGTLQACAEGGYWAPCPEDPAAVECRHVRSPISRAIGTPPEVGKLEPRTESLQQLTVTADKSPLEVCAELALEPCFPRIGLVRFVPVGDASAVAPGPALGDFREAQLLLRTTYLEGLQEMPRQLHADPRQLLDAGAVICTSDVSILRGPVEAGAPWIAQPPSIEVFCVALQRSPRCDDQGQYARIGEKAQTAETIDRLFACAAALGIDALVFSPPGVGGAGGCHHPAVDAGDLLRKAILAHGRYIPRVWVCQEHPAQLRPVGCWDEFAAAVEHGRAPPVHRGLVPIVASPWIRPGWAPPTLLNADGTPTSGRQRCAQTAGATRSPPGSSRGAKSLGAAGRAIAC